MTTIVRLTLSTVALTLISTGAFAQSTEPLEARHAIAWGSIGLQGDLGGAVNSSGIGVVSGFRAEVDANAWAERYDTALIFRIGGAYNITTRSQVIAALTWDQAEADATEIGLINGQPLVGEFSDYQGWGLDFGYRYFFPTSYKAKPFVGGSIGFQRLQNITLSLSSPVYNISEVPFYDDSWVAGWRASTGLLMDINERLGWQVTLDVKYSGVLSDQAGIGQVGFERINDVGNRWTVPVMGGVFVKF